MSRIPEDVQVTGSLPAGNNLIGKVNTDSTFVSLTIVNGLALVDTNAAIGNGQDVSVYKEIALRVRNTHNQPVKITLLSGDTASSSIWAGDKAAAQYELTLPANMAIEGYITVTDWPALRYVNFANVRYQATVAPTSGNLTVRAIGRK